MTKTTDEERKAPGTRHGLFLATEVKPPGLHLLRLDELVDVVTRPDTPGCELHMRGGRVVVVEESGADAALALDMREQAKVNRSRVRTALWAASIVVAIIVLSRMWIPANTLWASTLVWA